MTIGTAGHRRPVIVTAMGITQILAWGSTYYLPAVLARPIAVNTCWPLPWVVGGLSLGLLVAGIVSPRVGAAIERSGGRNVLAFSAVCIGCGQLGLALAPNLVAYVVAWLVIGLGMGAGLYDAAFATLGRLYGQGARAAITTLTLFGGFASTACWPLSALMLDALGWRGTCLAYAAIQLLVALPLYLSVVPAATPAVVDVPDHPAVPGRAAPPRLLGIVLAATLTLAAVISSTLSVHLLTVLQAGGLTLAAAVGLGALVGPSQVGARAVEMLIARYHHPIWTKMASVIFVVLGVGMLWAGLPVLPLALAFYGAGIGLESIARGTLPLAMFGSQGYARLMGRLALPSLVAQAAAPSVGAWLLEARGPPGLLGVLVALAIANVALALFLTRLARR